MIVVTSVLLLLSTLKQAVEASCTKETTIVRKEWLQMSNPERAAYINGVKCLQSRPSKLAALIPASRSGFDDFAAIHANQTRSIHFSGIFYAWHRHYLHLFEAALHEHCGYPAKQGVPYWDWTLDAYQAGLAATLLFDGSPHSLGGDGEPDPAAAPYIVAGGTLPHGSGGGCVRAGPFANATVPFGPFNITHLLTGLPTDWQRGTPHCLQRDLNDFALRRYNGPAAVAAALAAKDVSEFQARTAGPADPGIHGGGHFSVGASMNDPFGSPQDPVFYLHHGMLDRVWALWQEGAGVVPGAGLAGRRYRYDGTSSLFNAPDTPVVNNETVLAFGVLGSDVKMWETQDVSAGLYCYRYE